MKLIILLLSTLVIISQSRVHEFHAENNFICTLCKETVKAVQSQSEDDVMTIVQKFPTMQKYLTAMEQFIEDGNQVCNTLNLCSNEEVIEEELINHQAIIEQVNNDKESTWVAGENAKFTGMKTSDIKKMMGTIVDPLWTLKGESKSSDFLSTEVPATFDSRTAWPKCESVIGHIRDQSNCGSCWAHGTTEAFNDRNCIKTDGKDTTLFSVADTTGCCSFLSCFSMGCNGGQVGTPWSWFDRTGVVTGGDFGDKTTCYPYTMEECAHHVSGTGKKDCSDVKQVDPTCGKTCSSGNGADYSSDKNKAQTSYSLPSVDSIKQDLVKNGPVTAAFTVYEDFLNYKSGVYEHKTGSQLGGHAVKIVGYGDGYWIVNNSWNDTWGDKGTFKIKFGDCGIDSQCHAGLV